MNQILLIFASIVILGFASRSVDGLWLTKQETMYSTEADIVANTTGQSLIEEVVMKRFDENSIPGKNIKTPFLTDKNALGVETGENKNNPLTLDDVDDYDGYKVTVSTPRMGNFVMKCKVYYVDVGNLQKHSLVPTTFKRIDVHVNNPYVSTPDSTVTLSRVFSYRAN